MSPSLLRSKIVRAGLAAVVATAGAALVGATASAQTSSGCAGYSVYSAVGSAFGVRTVQSAPGVTLVSAVDANLPAAQAQVDSIGGTIGWAGAPYSDTVAGNIGVAGGVATANDLPVFAVSSYPAEPHEVEQSTPVANLHTSSEPDASSARAELGAPSGSGLGYGVVTNATAACNADGTLQAEAESLASAIDIAGVLRIGSVRSTARVLVGPEGPRTVEGTIAFEGVTVLGQPAAITSEGLVLGPTVAPLPENPLATAVSEAGITVRFLEATRDEEAGQIVAPGVEIVLTEEVPGVGSGPVTTTYVVGQAFARASLSGVPPAPARPAPTGPAPASVESATASGASAPSPTIAPPPPAARAFASQAAADELRARFASWSILPAFSALAAGGLLFVVTWFALGRLTVRYRWS